MAASSPALSNNSIDTAVTSITTPSPTPTTAPASTAAVTSNAASVASAAAATSPNPPKTLRGLNKPKCIRCGNVARSRNYRCPYQSCKSCCSKAQNPCHIHVLKANATFPEKSTTSNSPLFDQHSTEVPSSGSSHRVSSLRQLSNNFAQFNNVQVPLRSRKPLTRKEATAINDWRFSKLKEYKDGNIEAENEAFDRYMQNINLLEEVFTESTLEGSTENGSPVSAHNPISQEDNPKLLISELKLKLRSNSVRTYNFRNRIQEIVNKGLEKLQKRVLNDDGSDLYDDQNELANRSKKHKSLRSQRTSALTDLNDKLNKARNVEDLKACMELKSLLFNRHSRTSEKETDNMDISEEQTARKDSVPRRESDYFLPKLYSTTEIDPKTLNSIDVHFSTLEQLEDL